MTAKNDRIQSQRSRDAGPVDAEPVIDLAVGKVHQPQLRELGEQNAERETDAERERGGDQTLPRYDPGEIALAHAENVIESELMLAPADEKRVGVVQEDGRKNKDHQTAEIEDDAGAVGAFGHQCAGLLRAEKREDIEHHHHADAREQIREEKPFVFAQTVPRKARIESGFHRVSPPPASIVSVSEMRW